MNANAPVFQVVTRMTPDGASFISPPSVLGLPHQKVYKFDLLAAGVKRYSMSVGVSPITDYINFQISDIPNIGEYTRMFDQYRIRSVSVVFLNKGIQQYIGNSSGDIPYVTTAIDYNDNSSGGVSPTEYQSVQTCPMTTSFVRKLTPRTAVPVYNGVSSAYLMGPADAWLDTSYASIPHYQLIVGIGATSIDAQFVYQVDVLYQLEFTTVR